MGNFPHMVNYRTVYVYVKSGKPTINRASNKSWVQSILYHIIGISWGYEAISLYYIQNLQRTARQEHSLPSHYLSGSFLVGGNDRVRIHHPISGMLSFIVPQCSHLTDPDKFGMFGCHDVMFFFEKMRHGTNQQTPTSPEFYTCFDQKCKGWYRPIEPQLEVDDWVATLPGKNGRKSCADQRESGINSHPTGAGPIPSLGGKRAHSDPQGPIQTWKFPQNRRSFSTSFFFKGNRPSFWARFQVWRIGSYCDPIEHRTSGSIHFSILFHPSCTHARTHTYKY